MQHEELIISAASKTSVTGAAAGVVGTVSQVDILTLTGVLIAVSGLQIKNSGVIQPITDGVGALGRTSEFFSHVYSNNLITKSPNGTQWTISIDNSGNITAV